MKINFDKKLILIMAGRGAAILTSMIILRVMTSRLPPEEFGKLAVLLIVISFFSLLFISPVNSYLNRRLHDWYRAGTMFSVFVYSGAYLVGVSIFVLFSLLLLGQFINYDWGVSTGLFLALVASGVILINAHQSLLYFLNMLDKKLTWVLLTILTLWLGLGMSWLLTFYQASAVQWMLGQYIGYFVCGLLAIWGLKRKYVKHDNNVVSEISFGKQGASNVWRFAWPLSIAVVLYWTQYQSYRLILGEMTSLAYLGFFMAAYNLSAGIMSALESVLQHYYYPEFFRDLSEAERKREVPLGHAGKGMIWSDFAARMVPLVLIAIIFIFVLSKPLMHILLDQQYWGGWRFIFLAAIIEGFRVIGNIYGLAVNVSMKSRIVILPNIVGAVLIVTFLPISIHWFPETGIFYSLIIVNAIYIVVLHLRITAHMNSTIQYSKILNLPIFMFSALMFGLWIAYENMNGGLLMDVVFIAIATILCAAVIFRLSLKSKNHSLSYESQG